MKQTKIYLIGQIKEVDNVAHHPNRLVEWAEFVVSVKAIRNSFIRLGRVYSVILN